MDVQSLLFSRADGWTPSKAREWAKSHGYKYGKVHVTDQYVRLRQFDPKGLKVKRTITLGRGIRAVVARESTENKDMKRRSKKSKTTAAPRRRRRSSARARETAVAETRRRPARRRPARRRARETSVAETRRRRRPARRRPHRAETRRRAPAGGYVMESSRRRPRARPRRRARRVEAWHGNKPGHAAAARKGWRKRKAAAAHPRRRRSRARESTVAESRPRRRRSRPRRRTREYAYEAPRRRRSRPRRRSRARESTVTEARRHPRRRTYRRHHTVRAGGGGGSFVVEMGTTVLTAGLGFVALNALDRFLATYDPSAAQKPTDRFTSDGAGTLANALNVASTPNIYRIGAAVVVPALSAWASTAVKNPYGRAALEGLAVGGGVNLVKLLWNNVVVPLLAPKDTSTAGLQKSVIARLYPAEIAAHINMAAKQQAVTAGGGSGALSGAPGTVGAPPDVGPFALSGSSDYPDAAQVLRQQAGISGPGGDYPSLQNTWGTGGPGGPAQPGSGTADFPTAAQAMGTGQPPAYQPGPPSTPGPGPQVNSEAKECACLGDDGQSNNAFLGFVGDEVEKDTLFTIGRAAE